MSLKRKSGFKIEDLFEFVINDPELIATLTQEDTQKLYLFADEESNKLYADYNSRKSNKEDSFRNFVNKYNIELEGEKDIFFEVHELLSDVIYKLRMKIGKHDLLYEDGGDDDTLLASNKKQNLIQTREEEKTFPQWLNIPDDKKDAFAEGLKKVFKGSKGLNIRYLVEGLKNKRLLSFTDRERSALFRAMKKYFDWPLGHYNGIFNPKNLQQKNIESAEIKIEFIQNSL
ncbi:MAG TPA: hypothetical protein PLL94_10865 [Bacteroidales bacterium]|nr:hypothetical protein [Bacteroidales bacterium]HQK68636.1 hypothetical protein [Bacteroidales bacterium]